MSRPPDHDPPFDADLEHRYRLALARAVSDREIVGVDIGFVYESQGRPTGAINVRVHRRAGGSVAPLASHASDPESPSSEPVEANDELLRPGMRIANPRHTFGTLGLIVYDSESSTPLIMSSSHVLGYAGTPTTETISLIPAGTERPRAIATFVRAINNEFGDAAVAQPIESLLIAPAQRGAMPVTIVDATMPKLGDVVEKVGAATGRTCGVVDGIGRYFFSGDATGVLGFRIVRATPGCTKGLAQSGDSGAVWYRQADGVGVGLHLGSDHSISTESLQPAIACHLPLVLNALSVSLTPHHRGA